MSKFCRIHLQPVVLEAPEISVVLCKGMGEGLFRGRRCRCVSYPICGFVWSSEYMFKRILLGSLGGGYMVILTSRM